MCSEQTTRLPQSGSSRKEVDTGIGHINFFHLGDWQTRAITAVNVKVGSCEPCVLPGFMTSGGDDFDVAPEVRLDYSEFLCSKVSLKYNKDRESF